MTTARQLHSPLADLDSLTSQHRKAIGQLREFARDVIAPTAARRDGAPLGTVEWDLVEEAQALGGLRMGLPEALGGLGFTAEGLGYTLEEFAAADRVSH